MTPEELLHAYFPHIEGKMSRAPGQPQLRPVPVREYNEAGDYFRCYAGDRYGSEHFLVFRDNMLKFLVEPLDAVDLTVEERALFDDEADRKMEVL